MSQPLKAGLVRTVQNFFLGIFHARLVCVKLHGPLFFSRHYQINDLWRLEYLAGNILHNERRTGSGAAARYLRCKDEACSILRLISSELTIAVVKTVLVLDLGSQTSHVRSVQRLLLLYG